MSPSQLDLLRRYGIKPVKRRGQNFLIDGNLARAIAEDTLAVSSCILELGAGGGALTTHLVERAETLVCVEVDRNLCALLAAEFSERSHVQLIEADLAKLDWAWALARAGARPVVAGNLPYVLTSKVLFQVAELRDDVAGGVFMVQKEVAERLVADPGGRDYGVLTVLLRSLFDIRILRTVPPSVFWPQPDVASAVVRLLPGTKWATEDYQHFSLVVKTLFGQRRKQLGTLLRRHYGLQAEDVADLTGSVGLVADLRPEQIDLAGWRRLSSALAGLDRRDAP